MGGVKDSKGLTVAQLIQRLQSMPPDAIVVFRKIDVEDDFHLRVKSVSPVAVRDHVDGRWGAPGNTGTYPRTKSMTVVIK